HGELVAEGMADAGIAPGLVVLEPMGRNTAATAALAAYVAEEIDPEAHVLLAPADHLVTNPDAFRAAIRAALSVLPDRIVTFGITPTGPETGYGYIRQGEALAPGVHALDAFKEKPVAEVAEGYLREGGYSWNSGVFLFAPRTMLEEFSLASADIRDGARLAL